MNQWMNDLSSVPNGQMPNGHPDPSMSFAQQPQTINPAQFQNQPYLNGGPRTNSPAFNPMFQTNSMIPSKRSREDSSGASPRQAHNASSNSRSQTPGQPFPGYNAQANGGAPFTTAPSPFQHLQTSNNATPSPTIPHMGFPSQNAANQRMSTASPNPFSPQHNITGASSGQMDPGNRMGTPHDMVQNFMQNPRMNPNFNAQQFNQGMINQMNMSAMNMSQNQLQNSSLNPQQQYQLKLQAQARALAAQQAQAANGMHQGQQMPGQNLSQTPQQRLSSSAQDFYRELQRFCAARGRPIDLQPHICGQMIDMIKLYNLIMRAGGSQVVSKMNKWQLVAQNLLFPPQLQGDAAMEIQQYWLSNIASFEQMWIAQRRNMIAQTQMQNQMSPNRDSQPVQPTPNHQRTQSDILQMKVNGSQQGSINGSPMPKPELDDSSGHQRPGLSRQIDSSDLNGTQNETSLQRPSSAKVKVESEPEPSMPVQKPIEDPFVPEVMPVSRFHGPINVEEMYTIGQHIIEQQPVAPNILELGIIDIHALTMSIKSGMHNETRNALDTLITISSQTSLQLQLELCDDLVETLIDCAQSEIDFLSENAPEVSDEISLPSYEELVRLTYAESRTMQHVPEFGSLDYDLDRAADRVICITTLLRNFSFYEPNFAILGQPEVIQCLTRIIQYAGTKDSLLRSYRNTLDFTKDVIILLSNLSTHLLLPDKISALGILHFLLSFTPQPWPYMSLDTEKLSFTSYTPNIHKYLPPALDSLAKLLARDEPNRTFFKSIFLSHSQVSPSDNSPLCELLTQAFALSISPVPSMSVSTQLRGQVDARRPILLQGLLAAETLASFCPTTDHSLSRQWLQSEDCWVGNLIKVVNLLVGMQGKEKVEYQRRNPRNEDPDPLGAAAIVARGTALLKILVGKARVVGAGFDTDSDPIPVDSANGSDNAGSGNVDANNKRVRHSTAIPEPALIRKEAVLSALMVKDVDPGVLRTFCQYAEVED